MNFAQLRYVWYRRKLEKVTTDDELGAFKFN
jgi:hypothetical protein